MTTAILSLEALEAEANYTAVVPDTSGDRWRTDVQEQNLAFITGAGANPVVSIIGPVKGTSHRTKSMLTDYYGRIHVIPTLINLRNPKIGLEQPFSIWNSFLVDATLESVIEVDAVGLINTAIPVIVFGPTKLKDFSITVTSSASIVIDALYTFVFDVGSGQLRFLAERAVLFNYKPELPFVQNLSYSTDILRAHDGTEQRISIRPLPRMTLSGLVIFKNDLQIRKFRAQLFIGVVSPIVLPLWHEPFVLTAEALSGTSSLSGDFTIADWLVNDFLFIETPDEATSELIRIDTKSDSLITLANVLGSSYKVGSFVYPTLTCDLEDGSGFGRYPVNASEISLKAQGFDRRLLGGKTASVPAYNSLQILDRRPLNNDLVSESFNINSQRIDYGGAINVSSGQDFSKIFRSLEFSISDRDDLQFWKLFIDSLSGRREPFYLPTFRSDLILTSQPDIGGSVLLVDSDPNYVTDWWISIGHKSIVLTNLDGNRLYRDIVSAVDNGDGTVTLNLDTPLPGTAGESTITLIEFLELVHLGSDIVSFLHYGINSVIKFTISSTEE